MDNDLLVRIIAAEKEIQECLEDEKAKAREWLENVGREAEEDFGREMAETRESLSKTVEAAKKEAEHRAALILSAAENQGGRIEKVEDDILRRVMMRHLHKILPT
jgi:vacuolar-type H+-ATPase subunit H